LPDANLSQKQTTRENRGNSLGDIMAHVVVRVGDNLIESAITRRSADELKLEKGDTVVAIIKSTEVMIQKD